MTIAQKQARYEGAPALVMSCKELEDQADLRDMDEVLAAGETPNAWERAKAALGVK